MYCISYLYVGLYVYIYITVYICIQYISIHAHMSKQYCLMFLKPTGSSDIFQAGWIHSVWLLGPGALQQDATNHETGCLSPKRKPLQLIVAEAWKAALFGSILNSTNSVLSTISMVSTCFIENPHLRLKLGDNTPGDVAGCDAGGDSDEGVTCDAAGSEGVTCDVSVGGEAFGRRPRRAAAAGAEASGAGDGLDGLDGSGSGLTFWKGSKALKVLREHKGTQKIFKRNAS